MQVHLFSTQIKPAVLLKFRISADLMPPQNSRVAPPGGVGAYIWFPAEFTESVYWVSHEAISWLSPGETPAAALPGEAVLGDYPRERLVGVRPENLVLASWYERGCMLSYSQLQSDASVGVLTYAGTGSFEGGTPPLLMEYIRLTDDYQAQRLLELVADENPSLAPRSDVRGGSSGTGSADGRPWPLAQMSLINHDGVMDF